ncbi:MAG: cell division protein FtsA [Pseudomonadota bacterium]
MATTLHKRHPQSRAKAGTLVAALDIGSTKVACLIGRVDPLVPEGFAYLGGGRQQSRGFECGRITDIEALERSIRLAVEDAEREAGERIDRVILGVSGPHLQSDLVDVETQLGEREITTRDVRKLWAQAMSKHVSRDRELLSAFPVSYGVDDQSEISEPVGMIGDYLAARVHLVSAPKSLISNLRECLSRAHLEVEQIVPSAIASAAGSLIDDELENGGICVDLGGSMTTVSVFQKGIPAWTGVIRIGGGHVTRDLAQGIGTTFAAAERVKTLYGTADLEGPGLAERVEAPRLGDDGRLKADRMARGDLAAMIHPRIEETFELVGDLIAKCPLEMIPHRLVLTGGASQLPGVRDVSSSSLNVPLRLGRPTSADILSEKFANPAFSTAAGLLSYQLRGFTEAVRAGAATATTGGTTGGRLVRRVLDWIRDNF